MEALLQLFKESGMVHLSFMIVNSKQELATAMIEHLESRVTFPVHQETSKEEVWSVMEGGKDDMYIYDRCGRLTYYIPFPLSVIHHEQPIVQAALFSTYFDSPCGTDCEANSTFVDSIAEEREDLDTIHNQNGTGIVVDVEDNFPNLIDDETKVDRNASDTAEDLGSGMGDETTIQSLVVDSEAFQIDLHNSTEQENDSHVETTKQKEHGLLWGIFHRIWGSGNEIVNNLNATNQSGHGEIHTMEENPSIDANDVERQNHEDTREDGDHNHKHHGHKHEEKENEESEWNEEKSSQSSKACQEADEKVCKEWSKRRLRNAQKCCSFIHDDESDDQANDHEIRRGCKNFGKKRCKKIMPILKCCLKTELTSKEEEDGDKEVVEKVM